MSEILANIVVQQTDINFQPEVNNINVTPEAINLNIFTAGAPGAGQSSNTELLFNNQNLIDGVPFTSYDGSKLTLGNASNIKITGGTNGFVLQTDGTGNLTWTAQTGGGGNGSPGGSNTQIQFNDNGTFGGSTAFVFDKNANTVTLNGNITASNFIGNITGNISNAINANYSNFAGTIVNASQPNITSVGNLTSLTVTGNLTGNLISGTLTTNAQPNITSIGTLSSLNVNGRINTYGANILYGIERAALIGAQTGTFNFDVLDNAVQYSTANATADININFRGNLSTSLTSILNTGQSITATYIMTTGAAGYVVNSILIDNAGYTPKYAGTVGVVSNVATAYTYTIIKTSANTFSVLGSITRYA